MLKGRREAERIILDLGLRIVDQGRNNHHYWILETPNGKKLKYTIPNDTTEGRFWHNWKSQLRRRVADYAATDRGGTEPGGAMGTGGAPRGGSGLDAQKRKGGAR